MLQCDEAALSEARTATILPISSPRMAETTDGAPLTTTTTTTTTTATTHIANPVPLAFRGT